MLTLCQPLTHRAYDASVHSCCSGYDIGHFPIHDITCIMCVCIDCLVSENKVLTHPSSVDSQTTSAGTEDHVSMGGFAARKALTVVEHVENGT